MFYGMLLVIPLPFFGRGPGAAFHCFTSSSDRPIKVTSFLEQITHLYLLLAIAIAVLRGPVWVD